MNRSFLKVSALTAGLSAVSGVVMADNMGLTIGGQVGVGGLLGSDGLVKFAGNEKVGNETLTDATAQEKNGLINEPAAGKDLVWDAGVRFSYDFGTDKEEMLGVEIGAKFFMNKHTATFKNGATTAGASTSATELTSGVSLSGISADLSGRIIPMHFDGGFMVITLGVDSKFNLVGKDFIAPKRGDKDVLDGVSEEDKNKLKSAINAMNFAGKLGVGANFVDEMIHVSLNARYWFMDQVDRTNADLVNVDAGLSRLSVGNGLDATISLGFNMMPLFA